MHLYVRVARAIVLAGPILASCSSTQSQPAGPVQVSVSPASVALDQGQGQTFAAAVTGSADQAVIWSVREAGGGTVEGDGRYTAPRTPGTFHVIATSHAAPATTGAAEVVVAAVGISISPPAAMVVRGGQVTLQATVTGTTDHEVSWSVTESAGGTVFADGTYTAPGVLGTYHVVATAHADATRTATVAIEVANVAVNISPATVTVAAGQQQSFTASVQGIADTRLTWSVQELGGGTVGADGTYVAPIAAGTWHVIAASSAVPSARAIATVTVPDGLPAAVPLTNVTASVHGDTARISFDPVDGAADYRVYVAPALSDLTSTADGVPAIRNGLYRCAGDRPAPGVPTDGEAQVPGGAVTAVVAGTVLGYARSANDAVLGYVYAEPAPGRTPVWAMGDPAPDADNTCYFQRWTESRVKKYVATSTEHDSLVAAGWRDDGIAFYAPPTGAGTTTVSTALSGKNRLYFADGPEARARAAPVAAFPVLAAATAGAQPLYRTFYLNGCGTSHDELVAGAARFARARHQGNTPIPQVNWSGMSGPTTLVVEALDAGCPFQGHLSPQALAGALSGTQHQPFLTIDQIRAADPVGEVFVNGQHAATTRPRAIARTILTLQPEPLEAMDFADDFVDGHTLLPLVAKGNPPFQSSRYDAPAYDVTFYSVDLPYAVLAPMLGELWVTYADWASDTNGKFRLTAKQKAALSATSFLHVTGEVDIVSTGRRYPQIWVSTVDAPIQENLANGVSIVFQTFGTGQLSWPSRIDLELCDHRTWDVNNQCPRYSFDKLDSDPFNGQIPLRPHTEVADLSGVDRRVQLDLYLSTGRGYAFVDGKPWGCADLPAGVLPAGPVTVTWGDVLYHSGVDVPDPPFSFHQAHLRVETRRHFDAIGFKGGVAAPAWNESIMPCVSTQTP